MHKYFRRDLPSQVSVLIYSWTVGTLFAFICDGRVEVDAGWRGTALLCAQGTGEGGVDLQVAGGQ